MIDHVSVAARDLGTSGALYDAILTPLELKRLVTREATIGYGKRYPDGAGFLQRHMRIASDTLIYDLQFRLRCKHCNRRTGFEISVLDARNRGDNTKPKAERVIVSASPGRV